MSKLYKVFVLDLPSFYKINLLNELKKSENIYVIFLTSSSSNRNSDFMLLDTIEFKYKILIDKKIQKRDLISKIRTYLLLFNELKKIKYDTIIVNEWFYFDFWLSLIISYSQRKILILESSIYESNVKGFKAFIKKIFLKNIDIALPSGIAHQKLLQVLGYDKKSYITNGVGILNQLNLKKTFYSDKPKKFLFVGRLIKLKNIEFLIKIFNKYPELELNIVGSGNDESYLKSISKDNIKFLGYIKNKGIAKIYIENDVFLLPSFSETWGLVVEEAIYYGLPVLVSNRVGAKDYWVIEKKTGEEFDPYDEESFMNSLNKIINNYEKYIKNVKAIDFNKEIQQQVNTYIKAFYD